MTTTIDKAILDANLTLQFEFVPFGKSRNADYGRCLNWKVTVLHNRRPVCTVDYMAGIAHCPAYKLSIGEAGSHDSILRADVIHAECNTGFEHKVSIGGSVHNTHKPILPDVAGVVYSLLLDSEVLDFSSFEGWAENYGLDKDSRKAEAMYKTCLDTALRLRAAFGDETLQKLQTAFIDY